MNILKLLELIRIEVYNSHPCSTDKAQAMFHLNRSIEAIKECQELQARNINKKYKIEIIEL